MRYVRKSKCWNSTLYNIMIQLKYCLFIYTIVDVCVGLWTLLPTIVQQWRYCKLLVKLIYIATNSMYKKTYPYMHHAIQQYVNTSTRLKSLNLKMGIHCVVLTCIVYVLVGCLHRLVAWYVVFFPKELLFGIWTNYWDMSGSFPCILSRIRRSTQNVWTKVWCCDTIKSV